MVMWKKIIYQLTYTGLTLIFICKTVQNYNSSCPPITVKDGIFNLTENKYQCHYGNYYLFGNKTLICQEDGNWKGEVPYCANSIYAEIRKDGHNITKSLNENKCIAAGTNGPWEIKLFEKSFSAITIVFKAHTSNIGCPIVFLFVNNNRHEERHKTSCDSMVTQFTYEFKNDMTGNIKFYLSQHSWHKFQVCGIHIYSKSKVKCPIAPINLPNGYISPSNVNSLNYGEHVSFNCNEGFQLNGHRYLYCGVTNISTQIPQCQRIQCKNSPMKILNGMWENWNQSKNYSHEDEIHLICNPGYKLNATGSIKCLKNGNWSHTHSACLEWKFPLYLVVIAVITLLIVLLIGLFVIFKNRKRRSSSDEDTKPEHIYSEINEMYEGGEKEEPPPLPKPMTNRKIDRLQSLTYIDYNNQFDHGSIDTEQNVNRNITEDTTLRIDDDAKNVNNQLYGSD
ncbi:complement receptor type 2-like isoform X2 [Centruroides sculpturatus]|uniref:complement receptor type 2-like isoform X2 n=1 Tax=Centruroides sculpturatus TaxID=218467 RepID=UPI000C6E2523|nr:complement receptor type 2-like isoform X2 [Centruroides sculpturatus]